MNTKKTLTQELTEKVKQLQKVECKTCMFDSSFVKIESDGECEMCKLQTAQRNQAREPWEKVLERIKRKGKGRKYDCLIGISGGEDSSVLLYNAVKIWGLRVLVIHFNNRSNTVEATNNIKVLIDRLNVNFIELYPAKEEYDNLTDSLLAAGVQDADLSNDIIMSKLTFKFAKDNNIKVTINGHSYKEEGSSPKAWSFLDTTYLKDIYNRYTGKDLYYYDVLTVWDQIHSALIGMDRISPYHYADHNRSAVLDVLRRWGWKSYGAKHGENIYTKFVGNYLLPRKFKIDKRKTYLSALIREGRMTKEEAKEILLTPSEFDLDDLGERKNTIMHLVNNSPIRPRSDFKQTNYKKLRWIFYLLTKLRITPYSMYAKYCK